jgi:hypothetical protein
MSYHPHELGLFKAAYSVTETIIQTNTSRTGLYAAVKDGKLRLTKNGRKSIFLATDIAEFLSNLRNADGVK